MLVADLKELKENATSWNKISSISW